MVTVLLRGGLGNQMFQYAAGLALAKKNGTDLLLDTTFLNDRFPRRNFTYRTYDLDAFRIAPRFTSISKLSSVLPIPGAWLGLDLALAAARHALRTRKMVKERKEGEYDPALLAAGPDAWLWGFWQSEKYFAGVAPEVLNAFQFREPLTGEAARVAEGIRNSNSVSLSVRRSDYVKSFHVKQFGGTDTGYYDRAIAHMATKVPSPHFFIFSDDVAWCRENIKPSFPTTYVPDEVRGPKWAFAMELSSLCEHQIIANSTFWWWAAWLNRNPRKIVVAPKRWYAGMEHDDIVPDGWTRL